MKSIVLFSSGLDSTTLLALALSKGEEVYPLTVFYGQRHTIETEKSKEILEHFNLTKNAKEMKLDLSFLSACSLINPDIPVPEASEGGIPNTYVPSRNLIFLSIASAYAEAIDAEKIYIGINAVDYSGYPDCRPEFLEAFNKTIKVGTKHGIERDLTVVAPLLHMSKKEIVELGIELDVDYGMTHTCYNPTEDGLSCGVCDSCQLRLKGFREAGYKDPLEYADRSDD